MDFPMTELKISGIIIFLGHHSELSTE